MKKWERFKIGRIQGLKNIGTELQVEIEKMLQRNQKIFLKQILSVF